MIRFLASKIYKNLRQWKPKETLSLRPEPLLTNMSPRRSSPKGLRVLSTLFFGLAFSVKNCSVTIFTQISAAVLINFFAPRVRRLIEGGANLKIGRYKEIGLFNLTVFVSSVRKKLLLVTEASFHCHHSLLSVLYSGVFSQLRSYSPLLQQPFFDEKTFTVRF